MEDAEDSEWTYTANVDVTMGGTSSVCPEPCASVGGREGGRGREGERERGREGERERGGDGGVGARDARTCVSATVCVRESAASATVHSRAQTPALTHTNAVHGASALLRIALV